VGNGKGDYIPDRIRILLLVYLRNTLIQNLEKNRSNKNIPSLKLYYLLFSALILAASCNPTKYVPQEETLLDENHVVINREGIKKSDLMPYIKQKPNKRIFGTKFHLGLYNLSNINKERWPHSWLREIGEEPVIFDPYATEKTVGQIRSYVSSKGYFDNLVSETVETANRKSKVYYNIELKPPYTIRRLIYEISDTTIRELIYMDSVNCRIVRGKPYDVDVLTGERNRVERLVKDFGYYNFSASDHIFFRVDSTVGNKQVDIVYGIKNFLHLDENNRITSVQHSRYRIRNVYIYPDFVPKAVLEGGEAYMSTLDTLEYRDYFFITAEEKPRLRYDLIIQSLYLGPGQAFSVTNTEQSQSHLLSLKTFRLINIFYNEVPDRDAAPDAELKLDCIIQLTLLSQQSFRVEVEGTNSGGNLGGALNLIYQHKNLFHGAEFFNVKLKGAYEAQSQNDTLRSIQEYGIETSLRFPKFLLPFLKKEDFIKKFNPSTTLLAAYNYQAMPVYTRTMANATFGYTWNGSPYTTHIVNPLQLNLIKMKDIDSLFKVKIDTSSFLTYSYDDVLILGGNYSYIFNNQKIQKSNTYWFIRFNAETSGNMLGLAGKIAGIDSMTFLGQSFAQYVRADIDFRYNVIINDASSIVYRAFIGAGIPYGNSKAIPVEKQYFGGGANGIRAWQVRTLGPGSYVPYAGGFLNQTADIKLEANVEYRFDLFWILQGAVFLDAGNIWTYNDDPTRKGERFTSKFYDDIAVGTGTGLRFDLSFVLLRLDMGMKLRDPWLPEGSKWIITNQKYNFKNDFTFVLAIGYPF